MVTGGCVVAAGLGLTLGLVSVALKSAVGSGRALPAVMDAAAAAAAAAAAVDDPDLAPAPDSDPKEEEEEEEEDKDWVNDVV